MKTSTPKIEMQTGRIRFYFDPLTKVVFAYFPDDAFGNGDRIIYTHDAQHSHCSPAYLRRCLAATREQYGDLLKELLTIYPKLRVMKVRDKKLRFKKGDVIVIYGRRWFDTSAGNTYHSVRVLVNNHEVVNVSFLYGYDDAYLQTARRELEKIYKLPIDERTPFWRMREVKGLTIVSTVVDVPRKKNL